MRAWAAWLSVGAALALVAAPGPARAQQGVLGTGDGEAGAADPEAGPPGALTPMTLPDLPDVDYSFTVQGRGTNRIAGSHFDITLDTPGFSNASAVPPCGDRGGCCFGINLLLTEWYTRILVPIRMQPDWFGETTVGGILGLPRTVTRANIDQHRLRAYTADRPQRLSAILHAIFFQNDLWSSIQPATDDGGGATDHAWLYDRIVADLRNPERGLAPLAFHGTGHEHSRAVYHAISVVSASDAEARAPNGHVETVKRLRFFDPNQVETAARAGELGGRNYLVYFPRARLMGFPTPYVDRWAARTRYPRIQTGATMRPGDLLYANLHAGTEGRDAAEAFLHLAGPPGRPQGCREADLDWGSVDEQN